MVSARSISNLSFWAQLGSSNIKLELLGSAGLQQIKLRATLAWLSSTKYFWLDHLCCEPCEPGLNDERESRTKYPEEYLQEDDGLEDISKDDISEEITEPHAKSFLGVGQVTRLQF